MAKSREQAIEDVAKKIVSFADAEKYVKILVYGQNGRGKTRFAATGPNVILLDINERGTTSVRDQPGHVFNVSKWEDIEYFYWYLKYGDHNFRTVAIDNLTMMQNVCMRQILRDANDRDPNKDPQMPAQRDWGKLREMMMKILLDFRNLNMHVIFLAQERFDDRNNSESGGQFVPDVSPGVRGVATGCVAVIGRIFQKEIRDVEDGRETKSWRTIMLIGPHEDYLTKDRIYNLGRYVAEPTMRKFIKAKAKAKAEDG